jgi:hypothetical protein
MHYLDFWASSFDWIPAERTNSAGAEAAESLVRHHVRQFTCSDTLPR